MREPAGVEELAAGEPAPVALENAHRKAASVAAALAPPALVLGADTVVALDGELYGKPTDAAHARAMLERLAGRTHEVWSGLALLPAGDGEGRMTVARTAVTFRAPDARVLDWYIRGGEWSGRAGAYAIQGRGAALVEAVAGDFWNVVGLPVPALLELAPELLTGAV